MQTQYYFILVGSILISFNRLEKKKKWSGENKLLEQIMKRRNAHMPVQHDDGWNRYKPTHFSYKEK